MILGSKFQLSNPRAAMLFHWDQQHRQVRIEGTIKKTSPEESNSYFYSRPRDSQLSASMNMQSSVVESKEVSSCGYDVLCAAPTFNFNFERFPEDNSLSRDIPPAEASPQCSLFLGS